MNLRKQAASLALMHAADVVQPLLLLPYAGRVLGAHAFGEYAYALSIGQIAATVVDYGFYLTAQRTAASCRQSPAALAALFGEVFITKVVLCLAVMIIGLVAANGILPIGRPMFLCTMVGAAGGIAFPAWLLIGLERASQAAFAVVAARCVTFVLFLLIVHSPGQTEAAVMIQSSVTLISGIVVLPFIADIASASLKSIRLSSVKRQLLEGSRGFLYGFVERVSLTLPVLLVGHYGGLVAVGQYSIAEKFVSAARPFFRIVTDTFLPRVAYCARHDPPAGLRLICISLSSGVVGAAISLSLFVLAPYLVLYIFGEAFAGAVPIVRLMSVIPVMVNLSLCTSNLYMFNYGHDRAWSVLLVASLLVFLAVAFVLLLCLPNPAIAVGLALIVKEAVVLGVSAWFFVMFGLRGGAGSGGAITDLFAISAIFERFRGTQPRSVGSTSSVE